MLRKISYIAFIFLLTPVMLSCPAKQDEGTGIERGAARASKKKVRLELKLQAGKTYNSMANTMQDAQIEVQAVGPDGKPVTTRTASMTATNFRRSVTDEGVKEGKLLRIIKNSAGVVDRTQDPGGKPVRRTLILEDGKARAVQAGKDAKLTPDEAALGAALLVPMDYYVDKQAVITRDGESWIALAKAQSSPVFPYIDAARLSELALELPKDKVAVGGTWTREVQLPIGADPNAVIRLTLTSTLQGLSNQNKRQTAQIQVQVQGASAEAISLSGNVAGSQVKTKVDSIGITGTYMLILDVKDGRFMNVSGELQFSFALNTELTVGGKVEKLRVKVDGAKLRVTEDYLYDLPPGGLQGKGQAPPLPAGK
jgi:hypothetical protein